MLKIEKISKQKGISLEFQKKSVFFNRTFFKAFALAFSLHFLALLIFHIGPFKIVNSGLLPPAFVETDVLEQDVSATAKIDGERKLSRFPFAPKIRTPEIPPMPNFIGLYDLETIQDINFLNHPFAELEKEFQHAHYFSSKNDQKKNPFQLILTGAVENKIHEPLDFNLLLEPLGNFHAVFEVKIDNKTGRIFWMESKQQIVNNKQSEAIKNILKSLQFEKEKGFVTSGEIEIIAEGDLF